MSEPKGLTSYRKALDTLAGEGRLRRCRLVEVDTEAAASTGMQVLVDGRPAVNFSSNDYLGLSRDEALKEAAIRATEQAGTGSAASRLITGTHSPVQALEHAIAEFKHAEAALVFNSGYQANVAILQAILQPGDWAFCDKLNHASLVDGVMLSGAHWTRYRHLDLAHLEAKLAKAPAEARKWIITDSVFSMDGDYPLLDQLVTLAERYDALLMVDEAHATGVFGETGAGLCQQFGVSDRVAIQMGTFSKALGGFGAYAAGPQVLMDTVVNRGRGFVYSTALPPAVIGAAHAALVRVRDDRSLRERLWQNIRFFEAALQREAASQGAELRGKIQFPLQGPIVAVILGDNKATLAASEQLLSQGFLVQGIRPPTVPPGSARLRIAISAAHTEEQLAGLVRELAALLR